MEALLLLLLCSVPISTRLELFFSDEQPNEILERRGLPSGGYAWNVEDDDNEKCTVYRRIVDNQSER